MPRKILITPKSYFKIRDKMQHLLKDYEVKYNDTGVTFTEEEMKELVRDIDGIIVGIDPLSKEVLKNAEKLKAISKYGVGIDNIAVDVAKKKNIKLSKTPGTNNISVAELAIALMFDLARNITITVQKVKNQQWARIKGIELTGKTLGLIGCGNIGKEVAKRACGLNMSIEVYDPYLTDFNFIKDNDIAMVEFATLLSKSDFISLHLPYNEETENIISKQELKVMKRSAFLINTSRGGLIDENALLQALKNKMIAGAACDVFSQEPPGKHPLLQCDNFLLTPHIGANTREAVLRMATDATRNLIKMLEN